MGACGARERRRTSVLLETVVLACVALTLALVLKTFFVQAFYIPSESMEPGLVENDRILVQKTSYWFGGEPKRGDVVVFEDPGSWLGPGDNDEPGAVGQILGKIGLYPTGGHLVKRVVGIAGDTIVCCDESGRISVNGQPINENDYVNDADTVVCRGPQVRTCEWAAGPVPEGHVFVMGDNRERSADSSAHMCTPTVTDCTENPYVPVANIVGKVFVLLWPSSRFDWVTRPDTFAEVPAQ
ncbi:signal peptidase I [Nocardioides abyssi]|uniref:Signal peptidase I n=1 Tax=Nocardioides abyssi TaxID=3058370 RepID=A0ABT8ESN3_9ACTN|nr:signal peptidase I [Nocardioides abyssi]MDN4161109.1 signal peptidase I [Nocardioides abyssi]